ncbi:unnamed protein product [Fusarium graminearum]|uniref:Chromosome 1, complete genome n=1 Tax=Gibberella zeae (strain ATCC MYA-4620 / CBS 123657 / FGSC 9075 / NRRL 31084 / PH-1) TaxID=229533 RepID=A0A0E0RS26_GIBZE|nr:hypothetical protein FG05_35179 [Fusarium graminearum]CEF74051.1 unnamed protein product [Fusarium graminearum]
MVSLYVPVKGPSIWFRVTLRRPDLSREPEYVDTLQTQTGSTGQQHTRGRMKVSKGKERHGTRLTAPVYDCYYYCYRSNSRYNHDIETLRKKVTDQTDKPEGRL